MKFEIISIKSFLVFVIVCYINCRQIGKKNTRDTISTITFSDDKSDTIKFSDDSDDEFNEDITKSNSFIKSITDRSNIGNFSNNSDIEFQNIQKNLNNLKNYVNSVNESKISCNERKKNKDKKLDNTLDKMLSEINKKNTKAKAKFDPFLFSLPIDDDLESSFTKDTNLQTHSKISRKKSISDISNINFDKNELKDQEHNDDLVVLKKLKNNIAINPKTKSKY